MPFEFYVDIENSSGTKLGNGPLESVDKWEYTARFDRAGSISFSFSASDPQASLVTNRRIARAYALLDGVWTEVGAGRIDRLDTTVQRDGTVSLVASGLDLICELRDRGVGTLEIGAGSGATHEAALTAISALAPSGWTFSPALDPDNDYIYARYDGESVLGALVYLADKTETHFYRGTGRSLIFTSEFESSGVRAIQAAGDLGPNECAITSLKYTVDTHDLITRIRPYGSGQGNARLTLKATNRTMPSGYTLDKTNNYIENDVAVEEFGLIDFPEIEFKEITPIANTLANVRSAANMLCDSALRELRRRSTLADQKTYDLAVESCGELLRPMQTIRVIAIDNTQGVDVDDALYVLEATWRIDASGIWTTGLKVSTDDRWPDSDISAAAERAAQGRVFQAHPQLGPNSYWENGTLFIGSDQANHIAEFPFVLGPEVTTVERVRFRYKVTEPLSFISVVAGTLSVDVPVTVDSLDVTVSGTIDISHTHATPDHQHTVTIAGGTGGGEALLVGTGGGLGFLQKASAGDAAVNTNTDEGGATSNSGGSTSLSLSGATGSGTGSGTGSLDLNDAIGVSYGVYKAPESRTYALEDLQYRVNGGTWVDLDTGDDVGDDYYEIDITADVQDTDTFTPIQENNLIEIRRAGSAGTIALEGVAGDGTRAIVSTNPTLHGLTAGEQVTITGTTYFNGVYIVDEIVNDTSFYVPHATVQTEFTGTLAINKAAMVLAKLGVVSSIQAVALT